MARNPRSHRLTDGYRRRIDLLQRRVERAARDAWPQIQDFDSTDWPEVMAQVVTRAQTEGVRLASGYLTAYLRSERGSGTVPAIDSRRYAGVSRDGRPLTESLTSPLIGVKGKLKEGAEPSQALSYGLGRGLRMVGFEVQQTPRQALLEIIDSDERFEGFQRATSGTCGACMALSGTSGPQFEVHPNCSCVPSPLVSGVENLFPIPTGAELFRSKTNAEQDEALGPEVAEKVRAGEVALPDLIEHNPQAEQESFITQKPLEAAT